MSQRPTSLRPPVKTNTEGNVLWRVPEWFPELESSLLEVLHVYHSELMKFNIRLNLVSRNTERDADEIHFADCLLAARMLNGVQFEQPVYDIGSGNGFPGLVFSILRPTDQFILVESDSRKAEFLKHLISVLALKNCQVMNVRLETLQASEVSIAISRGFANLSKSLLAVNRCMPSGGRFYHLKGSNWGTEIAEIPTQIISLWLPELVGEYALPDSQARRAVVSTKRK